MLSVNADVESMEKSTWRFYFIIITTIYTHRISAALICGSERRHSLLLSTLNASAYACYTFECKIIRNVYMAHHYPSAIRFLRIVDSLSVAFCRFPRTFSVRFFLLLFHFDCVYSLLCSYAISIAITKQFVLLDCSAANSVRNCFSQMGIWLMEIRSDNI